MNTKRSASALSAALCFFLAACGGSSSKTPSGAVYMGPVANASVAVYDVAADGTVSTVARATTTTSSDGTFTLPRIERFPVLVHVTHGVYEEEANGTAAKLDALDAIYLSAPSQMIVSPYSNAVVADAKAAGGLTASNVNDAIARISAFLGDIDPQQTAPAFVSAGATGTVTNGAKMALGLGAESASRTVSNIDVQASTANIVAQAANGDTLGTCNVGGGKIADDGTLAAPASNCAITAGAKSYAKNTLNRSGIVSLAMIEPYTQGETQTATASAAACPDRIALLEQNRALFAGRQDAVQAALGNGVTRTNWADIATKGSWGPHPAAYGAIDVPASCTDTETFQREFVMAAENYWVDQNVNYCHHHVPGWLPPEKYRNASSGSTSGGKTNGMTCTAMRNANGAQATRKTGPFAVADVNWHGVDCSDFTSWVYNFAGIASNHVQSGIGTQACSILKEGTQDVVQPGVLLDINSGNWSGMANLLQPGDLLYILADSTSANAASSEPSFGLSHVVTWTGKHLSDLQAGPDGARYDLDRIGQPDSRLGGDFYSYFPAGSAKPGTPANDPWMIIDSHYAGPAYRPFIGWYQQSLSNVRRVIGADAAKADPALRDYVIEQIGTPASNTYTFASKHSSATATHGYRMVYQYDSGSCNRVGTPN